MGTTAASVLDARVHQNIGDFIEVALTTALDTSVEVISTNLNKYDDGNNDHFNGRWCYVTNYVAAGEDRKIYDYVTATGALSVRGAAFTSDSSDLATVRIYRYSYTNTQRAINDAIRELSDYLFVYVDDRSLVTNNALWDGHMEYWTDSSTLTFWAVESGGTLAQTTTAGLYRGPLGSTSALFTGDTDSGFFQQTSDVNPRLLDLENQTVSLYGWAYPEIADDPAITLYTLQADTAATAQTLTSTTTAVAGQWTLIKLESQALNSDLIECNFRLGNATDTATCYWDNVRLIGGAVHEYLLPERFQDGDVKQVYVQVGGHSDYPADDIMPTEWEPVYGWEIINNGTYKFLYLPKTYANNKQIRLVGTSPLTELSTYSGTTEVSGKQVNLLVAYSCYCLFRNELGVASSEDTKRLEDRRDYWFAIAQRYKSTLGMAPPKRFMNLPNY